MKLHEIHLDIAVREPVAPRTSSQTKAHFIDGDGGYELSLDEKTGLLRIQRGPYARLVHCSKAREITPDVPTAKVPVEAKPVPPVIIVDKPADTGVYELEGGKALPKASPGTKNATKQ